MGNVYEDGGSERKPNGSTDHDESKKDDRDLAITDTEQSFVNREANLVGVTNPATEHEVEEAREGQSNGRPNERGKEEAGDVHLQGNGEHINSGQTGFARENEVLCMEPGNGSLNGHDMDNDESISLSNHDQKPVNVDALGERPVVMEEANEIKASVSNAQSKKAEVLDEVQEIEPSVNNSLTGDPDTEVEFEASDNGALSEKADGLVDGDSAARDLSDANENESIEMMQGIAKDEAPKAVASQSSYNKEEHEALEAVASQSSDKKEEHESTPEVEIHEELEQLDDDGTLRRNISIVTSQHGTGENTSANFSSVQRYWAEVTQSDYFFMEGKRSPSFKAHDDGGSPFSFRSVDRRRSPSPFSQNQIGHGHIKESSPLASSSNRLEGQSEAREITSAQHEASSLSGHPTENDFEKAVREQKTHDLVCPVCGSCVTERIILRKRKRTLLREEDARETKSREVKSGLVTQEENLQQETPIDGTDDETWGCLACFSLFIHKVVRVRRLQKVVELGAEGQQTSPTISSEILQEERWERTPCLPLVPSFGWLSRKAESGQLVSSKFGLLLQKFA